MLFLVLSIFQQILWENFFPHRSVLSSREKVINNNNNNKITNNLLVQDEKVNYLSGGQKVVFT